jgi:hypothetical protein
MGRMVKLIVAYSLPVIFDAYGREYALGPTSIPLTIMGYVYPMTRKGIRIKK